LRRYKGLEVLLEAMVHLRRTVPDVKLVVAGAPLRDVDVEILYHQARRLDLDDVIWHVGYVPHEKVHLYFYACDVVALPYLKAYDSGVLKIAQALGRPAVVTDTGGLAAAVAGGEAGLIVPPGDAERLSRAIESLLNDEALARHLAEQGQALAHTAFGWQRVAEQTEQFYDRVIGTRCAS
jgi:glycosyltransferase involved in cell wall biosynthesis